MFFQKKINKTVKFRIFFSVVETQVPGTNKQNGHSAGVSSYWRPENVIQTAKVCPQKANKATFCFLKEK